MGIGRLPEDDVNHAPGQGGRTLPRSRWRGDEAEPSPHPIDRRPGLGGQVAELVASTDGERGLSLGEQLNRPFTAVAHRVGPEDPRRGQLPQHGQTLGRARRADGDPPLPEHLDTVRREQAEQAV